MGCASWEIQSRAVDVAKVLLREGASHRGTLFAWFLRLKHLFNVVRRALMSKERALAIMREQLDFARKLDDALLAKLNAPIPADERWPSVAYLRERITWQAHGMAKLLRQLGAIDKEEHMALIEEIGSVPLD